MSKKSQSALEYMMTYGWAILVIVIVAAVLYSLGIFSPSSSLLTTITGFSNLGTVNAVCLGGTSFTISMGDSTGYPINVTEINLTSSSGKTTYNPNIVISPNSIQTVTVPSSTLCSSGTRYSVSAVITYLEPGQVFSGPYTSTGTVAGTANSPPSSATSYEPLTITNSQNQGTPTPFQQMINVTSSSPGWADIASSPFGQNVEFFSSTGQILDSWLENYTSTHAIWWVKLTESIPAGSKQTIYMGFAPTSTNLFNTNNIGEAPQIPCGSTPTPSCSNYAGYDDGANVFTDYWNFVGTTLPSNIVNSGIIYTQDNGLNATGTNANGFMYANINLGGGVGYSFSSYEILYSNTGTITGSGFINLPYDNHLGYNGIGIQGWPNNPDNLYLTNNTRIMHTTGYSQYDGLAIYTTSIVSDSKSQSFLDNSNAQILIYTISGLSNLYPAFIEAPAGAGAYTFLVPMIVDYAFVSITPPNGVMPSVTFGSVY